MLTSQQNPKIKAIRALGQKKQRDKEGKFVVEGIHLVAEAINVQSPKPLYEIKNIVFSKKLLRTKEGRGLLEGLKRLSVPLDETTDKIMDSISETETPQGIVAAVKKQPFKLEDLLHLKNPLMVICFEIQDPGNLGTIIRVADAAGADGVILSEGCVNLYNPKVIRATMGSIFHLPIIQNEHLNRVAGTLRTAKILLIAADLKAEKNCFDISYTGPTAILIGNEVRGLPKDILDLVNDRVKIPMPGAAESLNAAVSCGIILYEAVRQRLSSINN